MDWLAFVLGILFGAIGSVLLLAIFTILDYGEDPLDGEEEYVDNTPTFR